jgi:hypothetical protein
LVQNAKVFENGTVGCNHYKGYELSCCPGAGTGLENTHTKQLYIVGFTAAIVGAVAALVAAALAFARWKKYKSITSAIPSVSTLPNIVTSVKIKGRSGSFLAGSWDGRKAEKK